MLKWLGFTAFTHTEKKTEVTLETVINHIIGQICRYIVNVNIVILYVVRDLKVMHNCCHNNSKNIRIESGMIDGVELHIFWPTFC